MARLGRVDVAREHRKVHRFFTPAGLARRVRMDREVKHPDAARKRDRLNENVKTPGPLGRGFLTNTIKSRDDFNEKDTHKNHSRFSTEHFHENLKLVSTLSAIAEKSSSCVAD